MVQLIVSATAAQMSIGVFTGGTKFNTSSNISSGHNKTAHHWLASETKITDQSQHQPSQPITDKCITLQIF